MSADPFKYFRPEASDIVEQFSRGVLDLEKGDDAQSTLQRLLRLAHTLKGAARIVKQGEIAGHAHAIEGALSPHSSEPGKIGRQQIDAVLEHVDAIAVQLRTLGLPAQQAPQASGKIEVEDLPRTIRADVSEADALLDNVAEARVLMRSLRDVAQSTDQAGHTADLLVTLLRSAASDERNARSVAQRPLATAEDLARTISVIERALDSAVDRIDRELRQLRETAERLRLVPAADLFTSLERTARDTARALGKQVAFTAGGDNVRLDAHILEWLQRALIQIVRNAVAHGIELPAERTNAGKPGAGSVSISVARRGREISFVCGDDGRGLDMESVRNVALKRGLINSDAKNLGSDELVSVLLRGGISTSKTVTEEAGRGIGLDVVREAIERLGGEVRCRSTPGQGTAFELIIPPSLALLEALMVEAGERDAVTAIPLAAIRATRRIASGEISLTATGASIVHDTTAIPFIPLSTALDNASWSATRNWATVILEGDAGLAAVGVERLLGTADILTRPLPQRMSASPIVAAAALDADGNPQLVLDADRLVEAAGRSTDRLDVKAPKIPVLVIDDSLTTRMLEQGILESAGYHVETAVSGEEGLERVRSKEFALILVDVEMPGIDGFTFIERIRSDPATRDIPAILVTSLAEPAHRQRGRDVGAQGYMVKSEFNQAELLSIIRPLVS